MLEKQVPVVDRKKEVQHHCYGPEETLLGFAEGVESRPTANG